MIPENVEIAYKILNSEELIIAICVENVERPYSITGDGHSMHMTRAVAESIAAVLEEKWGRDDPVAIGLRGLLHVGAPR